MYVIEVGDPLASRGRLLLVEDNPADARLTAKALAAAGWGGRLDVAPDGGAALDHLLGEGHPRPALILLDLNLPGLSGRDVLARVRAHPEVGRLPVVVLSTSEDPADVEDAYARGANAYVAKPLDFARFEEVAAMILGFWLDAALLPAPVPADRARTR